MSLRAYDIVAEVAKDAGLEPADLLRSNRNHRRTVARDAALRRIREETKMSLPEMGRMFGLTQSSVWTALRAEHRDKVADPEGAIREMWGKHTIQEIATAIGRTPETVRKKALAMKLGRAFRRVRLVTDGHRAFTPRCGEILRQHGVPL